jgi:PTH1 family peptidyl-tRNA hydrolase
VVVGLGNPGAEYAETPHNLGFMVVDRLAERHSIRVTRKVCQALVGEGRMAGRMVVLAKPQTYMNRSEGAVRPLLERYEAGAAELVVICDELNLPWTALRIRPKGTAGGHNGVESVIRAAGTTEFCRVRLGIHPGHPVADGAKFVLAPFRRGQRKELDELLDYASQAVESIIAEGVEKAMTRFNRRAPGSGEKEE